MIDFTVYIILKKERIIAENTDADTQRNGHTMKKFNKEWNCVVKLLVFFFLNIS